MVEIFVDAGTREEMVLTFKDGMDSIVQNLKLHEKIVYKGVQYDISDIRYDLDDSITRYLLTREGYPR